MMSREMHQLSLIMSCVLSEMQSFLTVTLHSWLKCALMGLFLVD